MSSLQDLENDSEKNSGGCTLRVLTHSIMGVGVGSGSAFRGTCMTGQKAKKHKENRQGVLCVRNTPQTQNHTDVNSGESGWRCSLSVGP